MRRGVAIAGVGLVPFGRYDDRTVIDLGRDAVRRAIADSGVPTHRIGAAYCGTVYAGVAAGHRAITSLGVGGIPIIDVEAGCASGGAALQLGARSIAAGECDFVLVVGLEKMPRGVIDSSFF
jgi:acetyl-CoA acetyltransferase